MKSSNQTLGFYNHNAEAYADKTRGADMQDLRLRFAACLPPGGTVLDFGCGSGRDAKAFLDMGFSVEATDGSEELCALASAYAGIPVRCEAFQELNAQSQYDGIWACASILHLPRKELAEVLEKIHAALKPGGVLYTSFKYGDFEGLRDGRYFTCFTEESLDAFWKEIRGLNIFDLQITGDALPERREVKWINLLARKAQE